MMTTMKDNVMTEEEKRKLEEMSEYAAMKYQEEEALAAAKAMGD